MDEGMPGQTLSTAVDSLDSAVRALRNLSRNLWLDLVRRDQSERWRAGNRVFAEAYFERMPELLEDREDALVLICGEVQLRRDACEQADLDEYQRRFPQLAGELAMQFELDDVFNLPADGWDQSSHVENVPDFHLPGYEILREIGRGASGIVYLARQASIDRLVAIKAVPMSTSDQKRLLRQRQEAAILSRLEHPNVVQIHDVVEHEGMLCTVLEYVDGPILGGFTGGMPIEPDKAATLARTIARTIHAVHEAGVLHRDLKPSNILMTSLGQLKITDFGLARLLAADHRLTSDNCLLGTPSYMPPELAAGEPSAADPSGDVYAIGAILYELLTGRPPFLGVTVLDTLSLIRDREPVPPSTYQPNTPRDLETICLKCLQKSPPQRYASSAALADDLDRYLASRPILARPIAAHERAWRWCRRNRALAAISAAALLAMSVGTAASLFFALRANSFSRRHAEQAREALEQKRLAEANLAEANLQRQRAQEGFREAHQAIERYSDIGNKLQPLDIPELQSLRTNLEQAALDYYQRFVDRFVGDPSVRRELAVAYLHLGDIRRVSGKYAESIQAWAVAVSEWEALVRDNPSIPGYRGKLADAQVGLAVAQRAAGKLDDARESLLKGIELAGRIDPADTYHDELVAWTYSNLADLELQTGRRTEAEAALRKAIDVRKNRRGDFQGQVYALNAFANCYAQLATLLVRQGRQDEAADLLQKAVEIRQELVRDNPRSIEPARALVQTLEQRGTILLDAHRLQEAEESLRAAVDFGETRLRENPLVTDYARSLALSLAKLGTAQLRLGKTMDAQTSLANALEVRERIAADHPSIAVDQYFLSQAVLDFAILKRNLGEPDFDQLYARSIAIREELVRANPRDTVYRGALADSYGHVARIRWRAADVAAAENYYRRAAALSTDIQYGPIQLGSIDQLLSANRELAHLLLQSNRAEQARDSLQSAIDLWQGRNFTDATARDYALAYLHSALAVHLACDRQPWESVSEQLAMIPPQAPGNAEIFCMQGDAAALSFQWHVAAETYARALSIAGDNPEVLFRNALLQWAADNRTAYRAACQSMLASHAASERPRVVIEVLLACLVGEGGVQDWNAVLGIARNAVKRDRLNPALSTGLGAALFHLGQHQEAVRILAAAAPAHTVAAIASPQHIQQIAFSRFLAEMYLAQVYRALGDDSQSRAARDRAANVLAQIERFPTEYQENLPLWAPRYAVHIGKLKLAQLDESRSAQ